jgi:hypothetical protein
LIVAETKLATGVVVIANVVVVDPAGIVTLVGGFADTLLEERLTTVPPVGAGPFNVRVPAELVPPITDVGETVTLVNAGGLIVNVAVTAVVPTFAEIVAVVVAETAVVEHMNVAETAPSATVTLVGAVALALLEERVATIPPVGAGPVRLIVPVEAVPPTTDVGDKERPSNVGANIVRVVDTVFDPLFAVMVATVLAATLEVVMTKDAEVEPAGTVTVVGVTALVLLEDTLTTVPP